MIVDAILPTLFGTLLGFLIGLVPGFGPSIGLIMFFPVIAKFDLLSILSFYAALIGAAQYSGSISTLLAGVPGEPTSIPMMKLRNEIISSGKIKETISNTAIGSFVGSIVGLILCMAFISQWSEITFYMKTWVTVIVGLTAILLSCIFTENKWYVSIGLVAFGWILAKVGYNDLNQTEFLTFGIISLYSGIPAITVLIGVYTFPLIWKSIDISQIKMPEINLRSAYALKVTIPNIIVSLRSTLIGYIMGLVPYIGGISSSAAAYYIEKGINPNSSSKQAIAAETANNAASISVLIPMLLFGIAIQPSEAILLEIILTAGKIITWSGVKEMLLPLSIMIVVSNLVLLVFSLPVFLTASRYLMSMFRYMPYIVTALCFFVIYQMGSQMRQSDYYVICLVAMALVGYLLKKMDVLPMIFAFLLQENLEYAINRLVKIILAST